LSDPLVIYFKRLKLSALAPEDKRMLKESSKRAGAFYTKSSLFYEIVSLINLISEGSSSRMESILSFNY
jgi:hypothetical protein